MNNMTVLYSAKKLYTIYNMLPYSIFRKFIFESSSFYSNNDDNISGSPGEKKA